MEDNSITKEWFRVFGSLSEPQKRWFAAIKSIELGYGGISKVSRATGLSRTTIIQGSYELTSQKSLNSCDVGLRKKGSGRKKVEAKNKKLITEIEKILEESSAGDPMSKIKWTCKSTRNIAEILLKKGIKVSNVTVMSILKAQGYSLRSNKKMLPGKNRPDRDSQFRYISKLVNKFSNKNHPIISVDTKKKELIGNFKNNGKTWQKNDIKVFDHDFKSLGDGVAIPYGAYDVSRNEGFVNVGTSSDTAEFAVNSIWQW
jgi:transposase